MRTIALLTDFGLSDNFVGVMKGAIYKINPDISLIDITHYINPHDIFQAAFLLKSSYKYFPKKTIFLTVVDPGVGSERNPIIVHTKNYFFVGPDNGVLSLAAEEDGIRKIIKIENEKYFLKPVSDTFHGRDIFAPTAAYLSKKEGLGLFGQSIDTIKKLDIPRPKLDKKLLSGEVIFIDRFGNLVTNIERNFLKRFIAKKKFKIKIKNTKINSIARAYQAVRIGMPLAIFGSFGFLEISVNGGSAKEYFKVKKGTTVTILGTAPI